MTKVICTKCRAEYDKRLELDSIICQRCQIRSNASNVRIYNILSTTFWAFGSICLVMIPLLEFTPVVNWTSFSSLDSILEMWIILFGLMVIFFSLFVYFDKKHKEAKMRLRELKIKPRRLFGGDE